MNLAARVMAQADNGEIWVTGTIPSLVVGSGHVFTQSGDYQLKGVPGTWILSSVAQS